MSIKYIKTFEHFQQNQKINGFDIEVLDANAIIFRFHWLTF